MGENPTAAQKILEVINPLSDEEIIATSITQHAAIITQYDGFGKGYESSINGAIEKLQQYMTEVDEELEKIADDMEKLAQYILGLYKEASVESDYLSDAALIERKAAAICLHSDAMLKLKSRSIRYTALSEDKARYLDTVKAVANIGVEV